MAGNEARATSCLRRLATAQDDDAVLLERFLTETDADAFAELVRRYGPMVRGVCCRALGNGPDADDAFQATFLVFARKAGSVQNSRSLGSWLFGVARFTAVRLRDKERRRLRHEANAQRAPRSEPDLELHAVVDEELYRLPDRYRAPLIACFLHDHTQEEAARKLGCSLSTLRRRLEQGQELLRQRLIGRGAVPVLGALATVVGRAPVSATIVETTTALVVSSASGEAGVVRVTTLAEGVLSMMAQSKRNRLIAAALVVAGLVGGGVAWQLTAAQPSEPVRAADPPPDAKAPAKPRDPPAKDTAPKEKEDPKVDKIKPGDRLKIQSLQIFESAPLDQIFEVEPSGKIALGPSYGGRVKIDGLTLEEAEVVLTKHIRMYAKAAQITLTRFVPPDGGILELRVRELEKEVKELRSAIEELRNKKP